jgi:hypothetical protein
MSKLMNPDKKGTVHKYCNYVQKKRTIFNFKRIIITDLIVRTTRGVTTNFIRETFIVNNEVEDDNLSNITIKGIRISTRVTRSGDSANTLPEANNIVSDILFGGTLIII